MSSSPWTEPFLEAIRAERDASDNTIQAYWRDLRDFDVFLTDKRKTVANAKRRDIEDHLVALDTDGKSAATRARHLSSIKQLYRFAFDEGWMDDNPAAQIKGPKKTQHLPATLSEADVNCLLEAALNTGRNTFDRLRNSCLMQLLYATGMRVTELVSLPVAAVRGDPEMLLIKGKGGRERLVPLSTPAKIAIAAYLVERDKAEALLASKRLPTSRMLFPSSGKLGHLTRVRFYTLIKEIAVVAGISPATVTPHTLRHAFATHLLANGADLRVIQMLLGHADIATTEIYTHVLDEKLQELVLEHHPLAD